METEDVNTKIKLPKQVGIILNLLMFMTIIYEPNEFGNVICIIKLMQIIDKKHMKNNNIDFEEAKKET